MQYFTLGWAYPVTVCLNEAAPNLVSKMGSAIFLKERDILPQVN